jgi:replicative DNA helicase
MDKHQQQNFDAALTDETKSLLLFKKFYNDPDYRELIAEKFKLSYYSEFPISVALSLLIKFHKKYNQLPPTDLLKDMVNKAAANSNKYDATLINTSIDSALNLDINVDENFIRDSVVNFISSVNTYNIILDNIERIKSQKDVSYLLKELSEIENLRVDNNDLGFNYFGDFNKHLEELQNPEQRIPTGFEKLDKLLTGGWLKNGRMLGLLLAASHVGKSLVLGNLAIYSLKQGIFAVIISLEMSEHVYSTRIDAAIANQDINTLHLETDKLNTNVTKFKKLHPEAELVIKEFAAKTVNCRQLINYLKRLEEKYNRKIDIVYIDYLTLLAPCNGKYKDGLYETGSTLAIEARAMSYELECPIISAVQGNRSTFNSDENTGMEAVSESIAIAQTADVMITLFQTDSLRAENLIGYEIAKNRLGGRIGETGSFSVNYSNMLVTEFESPHKDKSNVKKVLKELNDELDEL